MLDWEGPLLETPMIPRHHLVALAAALALGACDPTGNTTGPGTGADVRLANFLTDGTSLNMTVAGAPVQSNITFGTLGAYQQTDVGVQQMDVTRASDALALGSDSLNLVEGRRYTFYAFGIASDFKSKIVTDDTVLATAGNFKIRLLHGIRAQSANGVDLYVSLPGDTSLALLTPIVPDLAYGGASAYVPVSTTLTRLRLTLAGQTTPLVDTTFASAVPDGTVLTVVASDKLGGIPTPVRVQAVVDQAP